MAYNPLFKMSIQDADNNYYYATLNDDCSWTISTTPDVTYIEVLPEGWENTSVTWARDTYYMGIFRSMSSNGSYSFSMDGRAIIEYIRNQGGVQGFGTLTIWMFNAGATTWEYQIFYRSQLDFKTFKDNLQTQLVEISTLDSGLIRDIHAYAGTKYNVPIWYNAGTEDLPVWYRDENFFVLHDGIKLLCNYTFVGSRTPHQYEIGGFNHGAIGSGVHTLFSLAQYNPVQNNGATTWIGNDILQPFLIQGNQSYWENEFRFTGVNDSRPYGRAQYSLNNQLNYSYNPSTGAVNPFTFYCAVSGKIGGFFPGGVSVERHYDDSYFRFVVFEIDSNNMPVTDSLGRYTYQTILNVPIPNYPVTLFYPFGSSGEFSTYANPLEITINYNKVYVFGIIYDSVIGTEAAVDPLGIAFDEIQFSFFSKYNQVINAGDTPVPAPYFPPSVMAAYRVNTLLQKVVKYLPTRNTNDYGFPIPVTTPYEGISSYLSNPYATAEGDLVPYNIAWTSAYCMHNIEGQSYVSVSLNDIFDFCKKALGCGAYIIDNKFYLEKLSTIFDSSTMILDLGYDVAEFTIEQMSEDIGANLKIGYTQIDTNSDWGVDGFNTEIFYNTPASNIPNTMDFQITGVVVEQYAAEKIRAQRANQPIGQSIIPSNPSSGNENIVLYCQPAPSVLLPDTGGNPLYPNVIMADPSMNGVSVFAYQLTMRDAVIYPAGGGNAQNQDPSATLAPYISNMYYPERAYNVELSPCRAYERGTGAFLHSVLDLMDDKDLIFRNTYVMQYNNKTLGVKSIESNLEVGMGASPIKEFADKPISSLPAQLFKPLIFKVKSKYPINMYQILNTNPNGYVRFFWKDKNFGSKEYKFFINKAVQAAGTGMATEFIGLALPDTVL